MHDTDDSVDGTDEDAQTDSYRTRYEAVDDAPSLALVEAIATMKGVDQTTLEPLGASVDMEALDALLEGKGNDCEIEMTIPSHGVTATVGSKGTVEVRRTASGVTDSNSS